MIDLRVGDCREVLATLPERSVQCVVTSPPYFGLRDYNVPGQMGLEPTLREYIDGMVDVFRLVRDVLADDGVVFLNVGDSYYHTNPSGPQGKTGQRASRTFTAAGSGGSGANRSRPAQHEQPYDTGDTEPPGLTLPDYAYRHLCDECRAVLSIHTSGTCRPHPESALPPAQIGRDNGLPGSVGASAVVAAPGVPASTNPESLQQQQGQCLHCDNCGACLSVLRSTSRDARLCARNSVCTDDIAAMSGPLGYHRSGMVSSGLALDEPPDVQPYYTPNLKPKDLMMVPARLAIALQDDGWYLRSDIIWKKPNPMPESVTDRPTSAHEHIFLLTKSARYFYDADAISEPGAEPDRIRNERIGGKNGHTVRHSEGGMMQGATTTRNARNVWSIATMPFKQAHFATFPPEIPRRCILAGSREGDTVLDPFGGAGTTGLVADRLGRNAILIELNPTYADLARERIQNDAPLFAEVTT